MKKGENIRPYLPVLFVFALTFSQEASGDLIELFSEVSNSHSIHGDSVAEVDGIRILENRSQFDEFASTNQLTTSLVLSEVKFLVSDVRSDSPSLYFINSNSFEYHWKFFNEALGWNLSLLDFNTRTYTDFNRRILAGSVVAHDRYSPSDYAEGLYTIEFWPSDPIHFNDVMLAYELINEAMYFLDGNIVYHPTGETQVLIYNEEIDSFDSAGIEVLLTEELYGGLDYAALNTGEALGILRDGNSGGAFSSRDIPVFQSIPNDISHVAGIITTIPQTPLSHINLKAVQNGTPNVYIPGFTETDQYRSLLGKYVRLTASTGGYTIEEVPLSTAMEWLEASRPDTVTVLDRNLTETRIADLDEIRLINSTSYGSKAASLGELTWCLPSHAVPRGCSIPFYYYHKFMIYNNLYEAADSLIAISEFTDSAGKREMMLREFRRRIRESDIPPWMMDSLSAVSTQFEPDVSLRCRSSTNNEDKPGWSGAGLYSSYTHHPEEGDISGTIKQVWAGMWTYRAFEEREFHRIEHNSCAMGVIVHPSYRDEQANGVAVTRNIFNPFITGYYVNVQLGEDMVTNPDDESVPEEFIVTEQNITGVISREIQYIRYSNRTLSNQRVLSETQIDQLTDYLERIHNHYSYLNGVSDLDNDFAMEVEFKITSEGDLVIKQARPWVWGAGQI